ncbi:ABC1 family-domain-containing protein [Catenaria anguillulae PL171]|uniref:ABC1 family-domain-containing protein n=1 Tax=Catenaria anguillulae PL171 TaxID=765915 RepID=A0A1Y2I0C5_9FUNG|nr:ABC1 family-domain-containing protein [Catenaria anguillulae PL171]
MPMASIIRRAFSVSTGGRMSSFLPVGPKSNLALSKIPGRSLRTPPAHPTGPRHPPGTTAAATIAHARKVRTWPRTALRVAGWTTLGLGVTTAAVAAYIPMEQDATLRTRMDTAVNGTVRSVMTFASTAAIMAAYKVLWWKHGHLGVDSKEYKELRAKVHLWSAEILLELCRHHGGIYTKAAQHVGSLVKMVPKEYTDTLSVLQDKAPFHPFDEVCRIFMRELGGLPTQFFLLFDERPIAAASLAQVHRAVTLDGRECAVKIQYEDVVRNFGIDLVVMETLTQLVSFFFPEFQLGWIVKEFDTNLRQEFDFRVEARNAEDTAERFKHRNGLGDFHVPKVFWDLTTERIMTMEFITGTRVTNVSELQLKGFDLGKLQRTLIDVFSDMIFVQGVVHCDPHPGNMLVRWNPDRPGVTQLVLLDHGLYRTLSPEFRQTYCDLWVGILTSNDALLESVGKRLGPGGEKYWHMFPFMFAGVIRSPSPTSTTNNNLASPAPQQPMVIGDPITEAHRPAIRASMKGFTLEDAMDFLEGLPRDMLLVMRTMNLVSGVHRALGGENLPKFKQHVWFAVLGRHWPMPEGIPSIAMWWLFGRGKTEVKRGTGWKRAISGWAREWASVWFRVWVGVGSALFVREWKLWWSGVVAWWSGDMSVERSRSIVPATPFE